MQESEEKKGQKLWEQLNAAGPLLQALQTKLTTVHGLLTELPVKIQASNERVVKLAALNAGHHKALVKDKEQKEQKEQMRTKERATAARAHSAEKARDAALAENAQLTAQAEEVETANANYEAENVELRVKVAEDGEKLQSLMRVDDLLPQLFAALSGAGLALPAAAPAGSRRPTRLPLPPPAPRCPPRSPPRPPPRCPPPHPPRPRRPTRLPPPPPTLPPLRRPTRLRRPRACRRKPQVQVLSCR